MPNNSFTLFLKSIWVRTIFKFTIWLEKLQRKKAYFTSLAHCTLSLFTAPLLTLNTSLQMSVPKNVVTIRDLQAEVSHTDMA